MYKRQLIEISLQMIISHITNMFISNDNIKIIIIEFITLLIIIIFSKIISNKNISFETLNNNIAMYLILTLGVDVIVFKLILVYDNTLIFNNLLITALIATISTISQLFIYIYVIKTIKENQKLKLSKEYNEVIVKIVEEIKQRDVYKRQV